MQCSNCEKLTVGSATGSQSHLGVLDLWGHNGGTVRTPNIMLYGRVHGKRPVGRPRKRWLNNVCGRRNERNEHKLKKVHHILKFEKN